MLSLLSSLSFLSAAIGLFLRSADLVAASLAVYVSVIAYKDAIR